MSVTVTFKRCLKPPPLKSLLLIAITVVLFDFAIIVSASEFCRPAHAGGRNHGVAAVRRVDRGLAAWRVPARRRASALHSDFRLATRRTVR